MRYAIVSDIHANLQAWNAALLDIRSMDINAIICLGDIVGYGPNPKAVLESVYANVDHFVLGNHDAVLCGKMDKDLFSDNARLMIDWTFDQLGARAVKFFASLPLSIKGDGFRCSHGDFSEPGCFHYISEPEDALPSWQAVSENLLFNGHTHQPAIFVKGESGVPHRIMPEDFICEPGKRFIVNAGSIGQPRDGDTRASYCIFDTEEKAIYWRRIPFDLDACREAAIKAGAPCEPGTFLNQDPRYTRAPLREIVDFSPSKNKKVKNTIEVQSIETLQKSVKKWRAFSTLSAIALMLTAVCGWTAFNRLVKHQLIIPGVEMTPISALSEPEGTNLLCPPSPSGEIKPGFPGWSLRLDNKRKQQIVVEPHEQEMVFKLSSSDISSEVELISRPVEVEQGIKLTLEAMFLKSDNFEGSLVVFASLTKNAVDEAEEQTDEMRNFIVKEATLSRKGGWELAKSTFTLPANSKTIRVGIRGKFTGSALTGNISLIKPD